MWHLESAKDGVNMAEVWGYRDDGTNPCRHVPKHPESGKTRRPHSSLGRLTPDEAYFTVMPSIPMAA